MPETDSPSKPQKPVADTIDMQTNHETTTKFKSSFLYKGLMALVFVIIIPLFPSQAPGFVNQTILTRGWELVHLLFVGVAVSYGLFSRRTSEIDKENGSKFDNSQSSLSRLFEVSPVFDDGAESLSGSDENKIQTWSSQYYRGDPTVMVARDMSVLEEQRSSSSVIEQKLCNGSNSGLRRSATRMKDGEERKEGEGNVVLPSPIPWRSRSGKLEKKEDFDEISLPSLSSPFGVSETESSESLSKISGPMNLSPSPSISSSSYHEERESEEGETEEIGGASETEKGGSSASGNEGGPDVDKKADEFIAKFREQIRLQRVESVKRSSVETSRNLRR